MREEMKSLKGTIADLGVEVVGDGPQQTSYPLTLWQQQPPVDKILLYSYCEATESSPCWRSRPCGLQRRLVVADGGRTTVMMVGELKSLWVMEVVRQCFKESSKFKVFGGRDRVCFSAKQIGSGRASEALGRGEKGVMVVIRGLLTAAIVLGEVGGRSPL